MRDWSNRRRSTRSKESSACIDAALTHCLTINTRVDSLGFYLRWHFPERRNSRRDWRVLDITQGEIQERKVGKKVPSRNVGREPSGRRAPSRSAEVAGRAVAPSVEAEAAVRFSSPASSAPRSARLSSATARRGSTTSTSRSPSAPRFRVPSTSGGFPRPWWRSSRSIAATTTSSWATRS